MIVRTVNETQGGKHADGTSKNVGMPISQGDSPGGSGELPGPALRNAPTPSARAARPARSGRRRGSLRWVLACWVRLRIRTVWGAPEASWPTT